MGRSVTEKEERPPPERVRGECPCCGDDVVTNMVWNKESRQYVIVWECWSSRENKQTCEYKVCPL